MSNESTYQPDSGLIAKIRQAVFGLPQEPPKYAHPWSVYSPANFQNDDAAENIIEMKTPNSPLRSVGATKSEADDATETVATIAPTNRAEPTRTPPQVAASNTKTVEVPIIETVILKLVAQQTKQKSAGVEPTLASVGEDFLLAARLRSVSVLNRKVAAAAANPAAKRSGTNRPVKQPVVSKRQRKIEPPAVQRKKRMSAEVIHLKLALARAEHKQARVAMAG